MKYFSFTIILLSSFFIGCEKKTSRIEIDASNVITATVNTKPRGGALELYTIADSVQFIKLDNSDDALIGRVSGVHFSDSLIFIHDRKGRSILIFNKTGEFKYKIFNIGGGPGEYFYASHLMVDDDKKQLML
jgi:hypothetical protein